MKQRPNLILILYILYKNIPTYYTNYRIYQLILTRKKKEEKCVKIKFFEFIRKKSADIYNSQKRDLQFKVNIENYDICSIPLSLRVKLHFNALDLHCLLYD